MEEDEVIPLHQALEKKVPLQQQMRLLEEQKARLVLPVIKPSLMERLWKGINVRL